MIIGLSGKKQSGKDTVAKIIQYLIAQEQGADLAPFPEIQDIWDKEELTNPNCGTSWKIVRFADKLKDIVCLLIGCTREQLEDNDFKEKSLGEEWKVWYWSHYKLPTANNPFQRMGKLYTTEEGAKEEQAKWSPTFEDGEVKSYILTPRLLLQLLGTECGRQIIHPNIWVNALMSEYVEDAGYRYEVKPLGNNKIEVVSNPEKFNSGFPNWIITDVRFPNEAEAVKAKGGLLIRLERSVGNRISFRQDEGTIKYNVPLDNHESETALDNYQGFDIVIDNNATMDTLIMRVKSFLQVHIFPKL